MERERRDWRLGDLVHLNPEIHDLSPGQTLGKKSGCVGDGRLAHPRCTGCPVESGAFFLARRRA